MNHLIAKSLILFSALATSAKAQELNETAENSPIEITESVTATDASESVTKSITDYLPVDILVEQATSALYSHNYDFALKLFNLAANKDDKIASQALFAEAIVLSQRGLFKESLAKIAELKELDKSYKALAESLEAPLLLNLAELALLEKDFPVAQQYLNAYEDTSFKDKSLEERFKRLKENNGLHAPLSQTLRVGVLLPLSGSAENVGRSIIKGMQLKLFHSGLSNVKLFPMDSKGTEEGANSAYQRLLNQGVDLIIGPLLSKNTSAIAPYAKASGRPLITFSTDTATAQEGTYILSYIPEDQAILMARYAAQSGKSRISILAPDSIYGIRMARSFEKEAQKLGLTVKPPVYFPRNAVDITKALREITEYEKAAKELKDEKETLQKEYHLLKEALDDEKIKRLKELEKAEAQPIVEFDALFMPASARQMPLFAPQLAFHDINPKKVLIMGSAQWDDPQILKNKGEYLHGAVFPASAIAPKMEFEKAYTSTYLETPHPLSILGYQALELIEQRFKEGALNAYDVAEGLIRSEGFKGSTGSFRFNRKGINERLYDIRAIAYDKTINKEKAPLLFPPAMPSRLKPGWSWSF